MQDSIELEPTTLGDWVGMQKELRNIISDIDMSDALHVAMALQMIISKVTEYKREIMRGCSGD